MPTRRPTIRQEEWGSKIQRPEEITWPKDMRAAPIRLLVAALITAAMTFPIGTGLGWDGIHPRAICRLSDATLELLAKVIYQCETTGEWPAAVDIVIVAPLPKSDGGYDQLD